MGDIITYKGKRYETFGDVTNNQNRNQDNSYIVHNGKKYQTFGYTEPFDVKGYQTDLDALNKKLQGVSFKTLSDEQKKSLTTEIEAMRERSKRFRNYIGSFEGQDNTEIFSYLDKVDSAYQGALDEMSGKIDKNGDGKIDVRDMIIAKQENPKGNTYVQIKNAIVNDPNINDNPKVIERTNRIDSQIEEYLGNNETYIKAPQNIKNSIKNIIKNPYMDPITFLRENLNVFTFQNKNGISSPVRFENPDDYESNLKSTLDYFTNPKSEGYIEGFKESYEYYNEKQKIDSDWEKAKKEYKEAAEGTNH